MSSNFGEDDPISVWQNQPVEPLIMSIEEIRRKAAKFQRRIQWRNFRETAAALVVVVVFSLYLKWYPSPMMRLGSGLTIAGMIYMIYRINGRGAPGKNLPESGFENCLEFHKRELVKQRDLLRTVWSWYLGPMIPGLVVTLGASVAAKVRHPSDWLRLVPILIVFSAFFWAVARFNQRAANCLQRQIDDLNRAVEH